MMAPAIPSVAWTLTAVSVAGMMCVSRTRGAAAPSHARCLHVVEFAHLQDLAAHQARVAHPPDGRQRQHDIDEIGPNTATNAIASRDARKGEQDVHASSDDRVDQPPM
jgi:hypothetical protein